MPLFAQDKGRPINAFQASLDQIYSCIECSGPLKLRKQKRAVPHFYHLQATPSCQLHGKSEEHMRVQFALQNLLPPGEAALEYRFPTLQRIADVFWEPQKIVFEIQCSPIGNVEIEERESDYASLGCKVIWILDDRLFNKRRVRMAEEALCKKGAYFVRIHPEIVFYEQGARIVGGIRANYGEKRRVEAVAMVRKDKVCVEKKPPRPIWPQVKKIYFFYLDLVLKKTL